MIRGTFRKTLSLLAASLSIGLLAASANTARAQFPVDHSHGSVTALYSVSGYQNFQLIENFDATGDGISDNGMYLWSTGRLPLKASVWHQTAQYDSASSTLSVEGAGTYALTPVRVKITAVPFSPTYPGWYTFSVTGYRVDAGGNLLYDIWGKPIVVYPTLRVYANSKVIYP